MGTEPLTKAGGGTMGGFKWKEEEKIVAIPGTFLRKVTNVRNKGTKTLAYCSNGKTAPRHSI